MQYEFLEGDCDQESSKKQRYETGAVAEAQEEQWKYGVEYHFHTDGPRGPDNACLRARKEIEDEEYALEPFPGAIPFAVVKHVAKEVEDEHDIEERSDPEQPPDIEIPDLALLAGMRLHGVT